VRGRWRYRLRRLWRLWRPRLWRPRLWGRLSLRARLTVVASLALTFGLGAGAVLLLVVTGRSLLSTVDGGALRTGQEIADLVNTNRLPAPLPVTGATAAVVQVVDAAGRVRAASSNADHLVPLLRPAEIATVRAGGRLFVSGDRAGVTTELRVVGVPAGSDRDPQTVIVAVGVDQLQDSVRLITTWVAVSGPVLLAVLALLFWRVTGWTLRPVAALTRGAQDITGGAPDRRLPVPEARDEVHRLASTLNGMLDRIDASRQRQRAFVSDAAHELRSPLASIRTQLEVAQRVGDLDRAACDVLAGVLADVDRLSRLVDDLLLLARLDEGRPARRPAEPVELAGLVSDLLSRYASARVSVRADGLARVVVRGDADGLRRLVGNLVDNAVRHAREAVTVRVSTRDGCAVLAVRDDGPGVPVADRERMFDRFARRDDARSRDAGGSGLGLPIARELARVYGGDVTLSGEEGDWFAATARLPLNDRV
jgi:signal transduction histidine kinase